MRSGARIKVADVQTIGMELESNFPSGEVTPEGLVSIAINPDSVFHKYFEWDDSKAAQKYRLDQARHLIRSITVEISGSDLPAYHSVNIENEHGDMHKAYVDTMKLQKSPKLWNQVVDQALREAESWSLRYQKYQELKLIHESIKTTMEDFYVEKTPALASGFQG